MERGSSSHHHQGLVEDFLNFWLVGYGCVGYGWMNNQTVNIGETLYFYGYYYPHGPL